MIAREMVWASTFMVQTYNTIIGNNLTDGISIGTNAWYNLIEDNIIGNVPVMGFNWQRIAVIIS